MATTAAEIIRKAGRRFGDANNIYVIQQDFFDYIDDAQLRICRVTGSIEAENIAAANTYPITKPANMIRGEKVEYGGRPLEFINEEDLDDRNIDETLVKGEPWYYYYTGTRVKLYPDPLDSDTTSVVFTYSKVPTAITSTGQTLEVPDSFKEDVVSWVVARCHERNGDWSAMERIQAEFNNSLGERNEEAKHADDTYPIIRDDAWDDWI